LYASGDSNAVFHQLRPRVNIKELACCHPDPSLQRHLEIDGCLFTHVEPWLDPHKVEDLWYFDGPPDTPAKLARSFAAVSNRVVFLGHFHRWLLGTPDGLLPWRGDGPVRLDDQARHLIVVHAVWDGHCALFDTQTNDLIPLGKS